MNPTPYKPDTYSTVAPYLIVSDAAASITFMGSVFGAQEIRRFSRPGSESIQHAEVRLEDSVIMLGDSCEGWPAVPAHVHVYVSDVDAVFARAVEAGAQPLQTPVKKKDDDDKRGGFQDAWGTRWWVATQVGGER